MQRSGTIRFTDAYDYQANIRGAKFDFVFNCQINFAAQLTWVDLGHLRLLRCQENLPRVAHVSLAPDLVFVAFPIRHDARQIWNGIELKPGDIVFHSQGERAHQRVAGPSQWSFVSLAPEHLAASAKALTGDDLVSPAGPQILRPPHPDLSHLLRLHAKICRLAETKPGMIAHPEVARALEQDLLHALVHCLTSNGTHNYTAPERRHMKIIARFEEVSAMHAERQLQIPELCKAIGVSERTLRMCCAEFLGMSPRKYLRLQHLNMVRTALRRVESPTATVRKRYHRGGTEPRLALFTPPLYWPSGSPCPTCQFPRR
jgi:AraC-like DNA-binding protein